MNLKELLNNHGLSISDLDECAIQYAGGDLDDPLQYITDSITSISRTEREYLEGIVKQRAQQIRTFLGTNPLWEKGGISPTT